MEQELAQLQMRHRMEHIPEAVIPEGFYVRAYQPGDEAVWAEICKDHLLEPGQGVECWKPFMADQPNLVPERDVYFLVDKATDLPVATATGYVLENGNGNLHMVAARPDWAGHGLGRAATDWILNKMKQELPQGKLMQLKSDDWRLPAVKIYLKAGFLPVLLDDTMEPRWRAICGKLGMTGVEMVHPDGTSAGIVL